MRAGAAGIAQAAGGIAGEHMMSFVLDDCGGCLMVLVVDGVGCWRAWRNVSMAEAVAVTGRIARLKLSF